MLLNVGRARVLKMVDDEDGDRFDEAGDSAEVDAALATGQQEVAQLAFNTGSNIFAQETTVTTSSAGVANLTSIKPHRIDYVSISVGGERLNVSPVRFDEAPANASGVQTLGIVYVARPTFPATPSDPFVWGHANVTSTAILDQLMCVIAACDLLITEGEVNRVLEQRKEELKAAVLSTFSVPGWSVTPIDSFTVGGRDSGLGYIMTAPDTLQLVVT